MNISTFLTGAALAAVCLGAPLTANAVPAVPGPVTMTLADGSTITVTIHGDENFHYYLTPDNLMLVADEQGRLCYAADSGESLVSSGIEAHAPALRTDAELKYISSLAPDGAARLRKAASLQSLRARQPRSSGQFTDLFTAYPSIGSPRALVILVQYPDQKFITPQPLQAFTDLMTQEGYSHNGATGSARDYFVDNSRGLFTPDFDVYGPYTLPHDMAYYGRETGMLHDVNPYEMIADACRLGDDDIDFSLYDEDHDGMVDNVFVFYAGYGQNSGAPSETIWPHAANIWTYGSIKLVLDGVQVGNYACTNEIQGNEGSVRTGIGTFCHEFSHVLGLPDLYATDGSSSFTPGQFELMDVGSYLNNGNTPPYMSIYDRACLKWVNPRELNTAETVVLKSFDDVTSASDDEALMITTISDNEYYLLENRQLRGWDSYLPAHGMMVWHIDYDPQLWKDNKVNSVTRSQHMRVDIVEADGMADRNTIAGDPFPGANGVTSFTDNTTPSMRTWTNVRVEKPITNIHEQDGVISFDILGGGDRIAPVTAIGASEVTPLGFRANWTGRSEIYSYEIDLFKGDEVIPFRQLTRLTESLSDCFIDIDGLSPSTAYSYTVRAVSGDRKSANSGRIRVTTADPTFDMLCVTALPASAVSAESFTARWQELEGADSYRLSVYTKSFNEPATDLCDFTSGLSSLPEGWYTNANATSGMAGTFGAARPSLRMSASNDLIQTPVYDVDINGITFWMKASAATAGSVTVSGLKGEEWIEIARYDAAELISSAKTVTVSESTIPAMPSGIRSVRIAFERTAGSLYIDDIIVAYNGATSRTFLPGYEAMNCGRDTERSVTGLGTMTRYYYSVSATSASGLISLPSAEIEVLTSSSAIKAPESDSDVTVTAACGAITIKNLSATDRPFTVITESGLTIACGTLRAGASFTTETLIPGIYIVSTGESTAKVRI